MWRRARRRRSGALFTALALVTGSLWGKPMWGTYWVWDARLTSFLILLFLYLGYIALWNAIEDETRAARAAAILALVGAVDVVDRQIFRRMVEHAAPGRKHFPQRRAADRADVPVAAVRDDAGHTDSCSPRCGSSVYARKS